MHTDAKAAESARAVNARAYTVGEKVVFGAGQFMPTAHTGQRLLAHELTHVMQQSNNQTAMQHSSLAISKPDDASEREADQIADVVMGSGAIAGMQTDSGKSSSSVMLQRTIGDGHDLQSARFSGDEVLEACFDVERLLKVGDRGQAVEKVQQALVDAGFLLPQFGVDGIFKSETQGAVADFQRAHGLAPDGIVGPNTMASLDAAFAGTTPPPAPAPPAVPRLSAVINTGPTPGNCGIMNFIINWQLSRNSGPQGGFVIQDITFNWNNRDCANNPVPDASGKIPPLRYFEAWRVAPNSTSLSPVATDTFSWVNDLPSGCTTDRVTVRATARYHDNVTTLPAHMAANNPSTFAGILQSSLTDPLVGGNISPAVSHNLTFHWNCCPCATNLTVVDSHTP